jgi:exopolysaccharide biosynthesis polyprenyl glycosylphosphotransferase
LALIRRRNFEARRVGLSVQGAEELARREAARRTAIRQRGHFDRRPLHSAPVRDDRNVDDVVEDYTEAAKELRGRTLQRAKGTRRSLVSSDMLAAVVALAGVGAASESAPRPASFLLVLVVVLVGKLSGLYDRDQVLLRKSTLEEVPSLFQLSGLCALVLWLGDGSVFTNDLNRTGVLGLWFLLFITLTLGRVATRSVTSRLTSVERCLIVGDPGATAEVVAKLEGRRAEVVGRLPLVERRGRNDGELCADFESIICRSGAHRIIVVPGVHGESEATLAAVSRAQEMGINVSILPRMFEVIGSSVEFDHVDGMTLLGVHQFGLTRSSMIIKRVVDIVGSGLGLLLLSPYFALAALAIRLDSKGPVFFRQPRVGQNGHHFEMRKFRTMYDGADRLREQLAEHNHAGDGMFKVPHDPRVTRVGAFLRRYSLDEVPQLINVFRGEMSLVGPRPLILEEDARIEGRHRRRLHLTPGMTGPWQVLGTAERRVPMRDMVTIDYLYAGNWSLWTDVKILLRTALHVVRGHGL